MPSETPQLPPCEHYYDAFSIGCVEVWKCRKCGNEIEQYQDCPGGR